jgi:prostatic aicd phosphatase
VFDYMNVNYIHDASFRAGVSEQVMVSSPSFALLSSNCPSLVLRCAVLMCLFVQEQARALADYHEQAVFSSPTKDGIGNIAGQTMVPGILEAMAKIVSPEDPLVLQYYGEFFGFA